MTTTPGSNELQWKSFPAGENGFFRAPVLVWGETEAVLIDGGFTLLRKPYSLKQLASVMTEAGRCAQAVVASP